MRSVFHGPAPWGGRTVLALGVFDGVHIGHQRLILSAVERARNKHLPSVVVTFDPHPQAVTSPADTPPLLTTLADRLRLVERLGIDHAYVIRFTPELSGMSDQRFVAEVLCERLRLDTVFVGFNYRFGAGGQGTAASLQEMGSGRAFEVEVVPAVMMDGQPVSSSLVRQAVLEGNVELANRMLGHPFELVGRIIREHGRGTVLGFPTANIELPTGIAIPLPGVYAVTVDLGDGCPKPGVANVGCRPTFGGFEDRLEIHIFEFSADIYGLETRTAFWGRLREERKFNSADELRTQIAQDCEHARQLMGDKVYKALRLC